MNNHRTSVTIAVRISDVPRLNNCATDKTLRVMVLCAGDNHGIQDISFPYQSELKVNGGEVKANLRGLKNKPGSTRPVDITDSLRLDKYAYVNNIEFTYALTNKVKSRCQEKSDESRVSNHLPKPKWHPKSNLDLDPFRLILAVPG
jgi:E3 SUMO-protein ligase PIAS1